MTEQSDAGDGVGAELAKARAALGFSLADVAQQLKFAARQIEALEQGRYELLPTGTFARGMVRAYARLLKLDPEPLVQRIAGRVATPDNAAAVASVKRPIPIIDTARRTNLVYGALSLAVLAIIAAVAVEWQRERSGAAQLTFVPAAAQAPATPEPQRLAAAAGGLPPNVTATASAEPAAPSAEKRAAPAASGASAAPVAPAAPAASPPKAPSADSGDLARLVLKYERSSWVEIRGRGGKLLTSQLNAAGSEQTVEGKPPFSLIIGNAQYVRLSYNDRPIDLAPHVKVEVARFTLD